jgi:hypothetical protein
VTIDLSENDLSEKPQVIAKESNLNSQLHAIASSKLLIWIGLTCVFVAMPLFYIKNARLADPDIWWHMRTGEWILQNHQIPRVDPFSAPTLGRPWVDYCWMFDVASYWIIAHFDLVSIVWFETVMRIAAAIVLFSLLRSLTANFWKALALTGIAMLAMAWVFPPRPGAISVLFFVLELHVLVSARRKSNPRLLWFLPGLFAIWVNIHVEFVNGLFLLGVLCLEPFLNRLGAWKTELTNGAAAFHRQLRFVFAASLLAAMVNPYGPNLLLTVLQYARDTRIYDLIVEFQAMHFRSINDWAVLALLMMGCFALGRMRPFRPVTGLLLAWAAWMSFRSLREVWLVAVLSAMFVAELDSEKEQAPAEKIVLDTPMRLAVGATVVLLLLTGSTIWSLSSQRLLSQVASGYPLGAANYIRQNHLRGPILNELSWGGFLIYSVPDIPVSMDGRTNVHTQDEIFHAMPLWDGNTGWQDRPELQHANLVISSHEWPLALLLRSDPRFRIAYEDSTAVLFEAVNPEKSDSQVSKNSY